MKKCCNCGRIFETPKTCWNCKHFIRPSGPEYYGWGDCKLFNRSIHSEDTCDDFKDKEDTCDDSTPKVEKEEKEIEKFCWICEHYQPKTLNNGYCKLDESKIIRCGAYNCDKNNLKNEN